MIFRISPGRRSSGDDSISVVIFDVVVSKKSGFLIRVEIEGERACVAKLLNEEGAKFTCWRPRDERAVGNLY